jgi:hypothetical protein
MAEFHVPQDREVIHFEPCCQGGGVFVSFGVSIEGRVSKMPAGALEVGTDEKQNIKQGFQVVDNAVFRSVDE